MDRRAPGLPGQSMQTVSDPGMRSAEQEAMRIVEVHRRRIRGRSFRDKTAEKYALHVDGEGNSQWLDLYYGTRMRMVPKLSGAPRMQNNQLRPILDNLIAHLTTQPVRFVVDARKDKDSRERALMDQMVVNYHVRTQRWNVLLAEAKYIAACYGFCPIHQMVRDDTMSDTYEGPLQAQLQQTQMLLGAGQPGPPMDSGGVGGVAAAAPGLEGGPTPASPLAPQPPPIMLDAWVGNPWDMCFDAGAKRWSIHRVTFGRVIPTPLVRAAFGLGEHQLEGDRRLPSASQFQLMAQRWLEAGSGVHGSAAMRSGTERQEDDELTGLVYEEIPPGILSEEPYNRHGRLSIVALQGAATAQTEYAQTGSGRSLLLWQDVLPGGCYSWVPFYSHWRMDDALGKPFIADLDDDQIYLNQLESMADEFLRRANKPPLASTGEVDINTLSYNEDTLLQMEPVGAGEVELRYLEYPARHLPFLENKIERVKEGMYRKGAYQAASRGESESGESGKAIIALQTADDSILGPLSMLTKHELEQLAGTSWKMMKEFLDVPMLVDIVGEEFAHIAEPYVDRTMLSHNTPTFRLVSGFGTSTEAKAQQLMNMFGMMDSTGEEVLSTRQFRQQWPDQTLFGEQDDPQEYRERHARVVNQTIERMAEQMRAQFPGLPDRMNDPSVLQAAVMGWQMVDQEKPILRDDDIGAHIDTLTLLTQDDTQDSLVRHIAMLRQDQYWQWAAAQQAAAQAQQMAMQAGGDAEALPSGGGDQAASREGGTGQASSMAQADRNFEGQARQLRSG